MPPRTELEKLFWKKRRQSTRLKKLLDQISDDQLIKVLRGLDVPVEQPRDGAVPALVSRG